MQTGFAARSSKVSETADAHAKLVETCTQLFASIEPHSKWLQKKERTRIDAMLTQAGDALDIYSHIVIRLQDFEVNLDTGELHKAGHKLKLTGQPI
jgi:hypothetical protein